MWKSIRTNFWDHRFKYFFYLGATLAIVSGLLLSNRLNSNVSIFLFGVLIAFSVSFIIAIVAKFLFGKETYTQYRYIVPIMIAAGGFYYLTTSNYLQHLNLLFIHLLLMLSAARLGCYSVSCCHGRVLRNKGMNMIGYYKKRPLTYSHYRKLHTQLIESCSFFGIYLVGIITLFNQFDSHIIFGVLLLLYGLTRFITEYFRGDNGRQYFLSLSEAQWISLIICITATLFTWHTSWALPFQIISLSLLTIAIYMIYLSSKYSLLSVYHYNSIVLTLENLSESLSPGEMKSESIDTVARITVSKDALFNEFHYSISLSQSSIDDLFLKRMANLITNYCSIRTLLNKDKNIGHIFIRTTNSSVKLNTRF